jgi:predicted ATPase
MIAVPWRGRLGQCGAAPAARMTGEDMADTTDRFVVVTGGPGSGKTTLIEALAAAGFRSSPEAGRAIIRDQHAIGGQGLPWADRALFAELMLGADMRAYREAPAGPGMVIFDRGIPDIAGYLQLCGLAVPGHVESAIRQFRYRREVFIAPPWPEIFAGDAERRQDFAEARRTYEAMVTVYAGYGYELVELPRISVAARMHFMVERLGRG